MRSARIAAIALLGMCVASGVTRAAPQLTVLHDFEDPHIHAAEAPRLALTQRYLISDPVLDSAGGVYGTVSTGGTLKKCGVQRCGYVYKMTPPASGTGNWDFSIIWNFHNTPDGYHPWGNLFIDASGALY